MSDFIRTIGRVKSGELTLCTSCNHYYLTFNNMLFEFTEMEFNRFKKYIFQLEIPSQSGVNRSLKVRRNILVPTLQKNLVLIFSPMEIEELKNLFSYQFYHKYQRISATEIDYPHSKN